MNFRRGFLGPLNFKIYINDFPFTVRTSLTPIRFADDSSIIILGKDLEDFGVLSNEVLSQRSNWISVKSCP
jgi:hypothetical protein